MRHRILIVAQDVMVRSTLARWLMSAGYSVELAEGERRAREVLAHHRVALTISARNRSGSLALNPDQNCAKWMVVAEPSQGAMRPARSAVGANDTLAVPLVQQVLLTSVKSALQVRRSGWALAGARNLGVRWLHDRLSRPLAARLPMPSSRPLTPSPPG